MASVADSRFKQRTVIEFLVHENKSVVNIHEICVQCMGVVQWIGALLGGGLRELKH
jgi:hypothetical protein